MISSELRQKIRSELKVLPGYRQVVLDQFDWIGELEKIAIKFALAPDHERILVIETSLLIAGATDPLDYPREIMTQMSIPADKTEKIVRDVAVLVLDRIQRELDEMMGDNGVEIVAGIRKELGDADVLRSTGLQIVSHDTVIAQPASAPQSASPVATPDPIRTTTDNDPYREPLE